MDSSKLDRYPRKKVPLKEADSKETTTIDRQQAKQSYEIATRVIDTVLLILSPSRNP